MFLYWEEKASFFFEKMSKVLDKHRMCFSMLFHFESWLLTPDEVYIHQICQTGLLRTVFNKVFQKVLTHYTTQRHRHFIATPTQTCEKKEAWNEIISKLKLSIHQFEVVSYYQNIFQKEKKTLLIITTLEWMQQRLANKYLSLILNSVCAKVMTEWTSVLVLGEMKR